MSLQELPPVDADLDIALEALLHDDIQFLPFDNESNLDQQSGLDLVSSKFDNPGLQSGGSSNIGEQLVLGSETFVSNPDPDYGTIESLSNWDLSAQGFLPVELQNHESDFESQLASAASSHPSHASDNKPPTSTEDLNLPLSRKIGGRFSRESVRVLRAWLSANSKNPYPNELERRVLQEHTGLTKTQIMNWLANARRRGKVQPTRSSSPFVHTNSSSPIEIPPRQPTPALPGHHPHKNPLERWVESPPENEGATVSAIACAVASSSQRSSGLFYSTVLQGDDFTGPDSDRSYSNASRANSLDTSRSSGSSLNSVDSHGSGVSLSSFTRLHRSRPRRRRRLARQADEKTSFAMQLRTFQCTFCTETFKTKHDWQRHENSLHLPLERWVCTPEGPMAYDPTGKEDCCVFCGLPNPNEAHFQSHNHTICRERSLPERTFNRKDHLNQHLRLVHEAKFRDWPMRSWKVQMPAIRSRCGFCGAHLDTWDNRVHHLADHFRAGKTMADWKGDLGFDGHIQVIVENAIPPFLIDIERNTPVPLQASIGPIESPRSAYELIKLELAYYMQNYFDRTKRMPKSQEMQLEACRILLASAGLSKHDVPTPPSWLRDLLMSDQHIAQQAKFSPIRLPSESRLHALKINGKNDMFEDCIFEASLQEFIQTRHGSGALITSEELMEEACCIVGRMEEISATPSDFIASWLVNLIHSSKEWLANLCQRTKTPVDSLLTSDSLPNQEVSHKTLKYIHNYTPMERQLALFLEVRRSMGFEPTDEELRRQAQYICYESEYAGRRTAADDPRWISAFKQRHRRVIDHHSEPSPPSALLASMSIMKTSIGNASLSTTVPSVTKSSALSNEPGVRPYSPLINTSGLYLNDPNFYRWLAEELGRWVAATMSPDNPTCHIPSDQEIQHYARWIGYNDGDPWNQTAADNEEWLAWFKRSVGIPENRPEDAQRESPNP